MLRVKVVFVPGADRQPIQLTPVWTEGSLHITDVDSPAEFVAVTERRKTRMPQRGMQRRAKIWQPPWTRVNADLAPATFTFVAQPLAPSNATAAGYTPDPYRQHRKQRPGVKRRAGITFVPSSPDPIAALQIRRKRALPRADRRSDPLTNDAIPETDDSLPFVTVRRRRIPPRSRRGKVWSPPAVLNGNLVPAVFTFIAMPLAPQEITAGTLATPRKRIVPPKPRHAKVWSPPDLAQPQPVPTALRKRVQPPRRQRRAGGAIPPISVTPGNLAPAAFTFVAQPLGPTTFTFLSPTRKRIVPPRPRSRRISVPLPLEAPQPAPSVTHRRIQPRRRRRADPLTNDVFSPPDSLPQTLRKRNVPPRKLRRGFITTFTSAVSGGPCGPVLFDASMTAGNGPGGDTIEAANVTSMSGTGITVGVGATILVVTLVLQANSPTHPSGVSITWDGVTMTPSPATLDPSQNEYAGIFILKNPTPGLKTIAASWTGISDAYLGAISFTNSDTSGAGIVTGDNQTSSEPANSVTIPTASGDATVAVSGNNSNDPTTSQTKFWGEQNLNPGGAGSYKLSTGASDVHSFTYSGGNAKVQAGIHIPAAPCAPSDSSPALRTIRKRVIPPRVRKTRVVPPPPLTGCPAPTMVNLGFNLGSTSITKPAGGQNGDFYVVLVYTENGTTLGLSGFTAVGADSTAVDADAGGIVGRVNIFWREYDGTEPATFAPTGLGAYEHLATWIVRGADPNQPPITNAVASNLTSPYNVPGVTTVALNTLIFIPYSGVATDAFSAAIAGWTTELDQDTHTLGIFSKIFTAVGPTGTAPLTFDAGSGGASSPAHAAMIAFSPAPCTPYTQFIPDPIRRRTRPNRIRRGKVVEAPYAPLVITNPDFIEPNLRKRIVPPRPRRAKIWLAPTPDQTVLPQDLRKRVVPPRPHRRAGGAGVVPRVTVDLIPATFTFVAQVLAPQEVNVSTEVIPRKNIIPPRPRARRTPDVPTPTQGDALPQALRKRITPPRRQRRAQGPPFYPAVAPTTTNLVPAVFTFVAQPLAPQETTVATNAIPRKRIVPPRPRARRITLALPPTPDSPPPTPQALRRRLVVRRPQRRGHVAPLNFAAEVNLVPAVFTFIAMPLAPQSLTPATLTVPRKRIKPPRPRHAKVWDAPPAQAAQAAQPQTLRRREQPSRRIAHRGAQALPVIVTPGNLAPAQFTFIAQPLQPTTFTFLAPPRRRIIPPRPRARRVSVAVVHSHVHPIVPTVTQRRRVPSRPRRRTVTTVVHSHLLHALPGFILRRRIVVRVRRRLGGFVPSTPATTVNLVPATFTFLAQPLSPQEVVAGTNAVPRKRITPPRPRARRVIRVITPDQVAAPPRVIRKRVKPPFPRHGKITFVVPTAAIPPTYVDLVPAVFTFVAQVLLDSVTCAEITFDDPDAEITFEDGTATTDCEEGTATITFDDGDADLSCDDGEAIITFDPGCED